MFLQWIWFVMMAGALGYGCFCGAGGEMLAAALKGTEQAISLTLRLGAGYLLFCGLMAIVRALNAQRGLERLMRPWFGRLMPNVRGEATREAIALNLSMNMLGMGNAATPQGMAAMRMMDEEAGAYPAIRQDMKMLLILNATSIQLLPTTVLALRAAAGSARVNAVLLPTLLCTAVSTVTGALLGRMACRWKEHASWRRIG